MIAGPDQLVLATSVETRGEDLKTVADFTVEEGETLGFTLGWASSYRPLPPAYDAAAAVDDLKRNWSAWSSTYKPKGEWSEAVERSLITLKAFSHFETGGIVAAATTSLPEEIGGARNWDYRYCWLRDSTFTLYALMTAGFTEEANAWRHPIDLVPLCEAAFAELPGRLGSGANRRDEWRAHAALSEALLDERPEGIVAALQAAVAEGAAPTDLSRSLAYAAALRVARF